MKYKVGDIFIYSGSKTIIKVHEIKNNLYLCSNSCEYNVHKNSKRWRAEQHIDRGLRLKRLKKLTKLEKLFYEI